MLKALPEVTGGISHPMSSPSLEKKINNYKHLSFNEKKIIKQTDRQIINYLELLWGAAQHSLPHKEEAGRPSGEALQ